MNIALKLLIIFVFSIPPMIASGRTLISLETTQRDYSSLMHIVLEGVLQTTFFIGGVSAYLLSIHVKEQLNTLTKERTHD